MSSNERFGTPEVAPNRAARRAAGGRARKIGAVGSGAVLATGMAAAVVGMTGGAAGAATTWVVTDSGDGASTCPGASCTLREAVADASDGDTITFDPTITAIQLANDQIDLNDSITITGLGSGALTVTAATDHRVFYGHGSAVVTITGVTLTGGHPLYSGGSSRTGEGGAVLFYCDGGSGSLNLDDVVVTGNKAGEDQNGGGIAFDNCGDLSIANSTVSHNEGYYAGGGVSFVDSGTFTMTHSLVDQNSTTYYGGGVYLDDNDGAARSVITFSTFSTNHAVDNDGGGLVVDDTNTDILNSTFSGNTAGDDGGGLYVTQGSSYTLTIANTTFAGNHADSNGGGIAVEVGDLVLDQSTISGNTADGFGDGLYLNETDPGQPLAAQETKAPGQTGKHKHGAESTDVKALDSGAVTVSGTIIAGNADGTDDVGTDAESGTATLTSDHSLFGTVNPAVIVTDAGGTQTGVANPGLGALADNGGPTQTMALLAGSPALDAGPNPVAPFTGNEFDQRGAGYARVINGVVDVGAYELQSLAIVPRFTG